MFKIKCSYPSVQFPLYIPVLPPSRPSQQQNAITAARGVRHCSFAGRPLRLCESRGTLNSPLWIRAQPGRQTVLAHFEFKMKSQVVMKLSLPLPPCPLSHSYPFALPIQSFPFLKHILTAAMKSKRVTVSVPLHDREASTLCCMSACMELRVLCINNLT